MAKNEPNKPDDIKTAPANEMQADEKNQSEQPLEAGGDNTPTEISTEETAALGNDGKAALHGISDDGLEPPTPFDIPMPTDPGNVVVSFDKINEIISEKKAAKAQEAEQPAPDKKEQETPAKKTGRCGRPPKADKADKKPKSEKTPKAEKSAKAPKSAGKQAPAPANRNRLYI